MARVYSSVLFDFPNTAIGTYSSDPVPDGTLWVVRDIVACMDFVGDSWGSQGIQMFDNAGAPMFRVAPAEVLAGHFYHWQGRQIMDVGDVISVTTLDDNWSWRISGYQLTLP